MLVTLELAKWVAKELRLRFSPAELEQLRQGIEVELEHGGLNPLTGIINGDVIKAARIALAHLYELPDYYIRLRAMEKVRGVGSVNGHPRGRINRPLVGDWGCPGVDTDRWRAENQCPLFPGKMNRWLLARTLRDNPTADDLRQTLNFVFAKWFEGYLIDPLLATEEGGRAGGGIFENMSIDNLREVKASREAFKLNSPARRREDLREGPLPMVNSEGGVIYIECEFAYRGQQTSMPWPVRTAAPGGFVQLRSSAECPVDADWILLSAGQPAADAPPERNISDILRQKAGDAIVPVIKIATWPLAAVAGVALLLWFARRQIGV